MNTPAEILQIWIGNGVKKANLPVFKMILLGMAAGVRLYSCSLVSSLYWHSTDQSSWSSSIKYSTA